MEDLSDQGTDKSVLEAEDAAMGEQADYQVLNVLLSVEGPETDTVEPVLVGWVAGWVSGWDVCP